MPEFAPSPSASTVGGETLGAGPEDRGNPLDSFQQLPQNTRGRWSARPRSGGVQRWYRDFCESRTQDEAQKEAAGREDGDRAGQAGGNI